MFHRAHDCGHGVGWSLLCGLMLQLSTLARAIGKQSGNKYGKQ